MKFVFEAMDKTGMEVRDFVEADNQSDAMAKIRQRGLFVTKLTYVKENLFSPTSTVTKKFSLPANMNHWIPFSLGFLAGFLLGLLIYLVCCF